MLVGTHFSWRDHTATIKTAFPAICFAAFSREILPRCDGNFCCVASAGVVFSVAAVSSVVYFRRDLFLLWLAHLSTFSHYVSRDDRLQRHHATLSLFSFVLTRGWEKRHERLGLWSRAFFNNQKSGWDAVHVPSFIVLFSFISYFPFLSFPFLSSLPLTPARGDPGLVSRGRLHVWWFAATLPAWVAFCHFSYSLLHRLCRPPFPFLFFFFSSSLLWTHLCKVRPLATKTTHCRVVHPVIPSSPWPARWAVSIASHIFESAEE